MENCFGEFSAGISFKCRMFSYKLSELFATTYKILLQENVWDYNYTH